MAGQAKQVLDLKRQAVDQALDRLLTVDGGDLAAAMRYAVLGPGKRFRPLLLLSAGESQGEETEKLMPFACAVELIHSYSLIHDDLPCMDNDDYRRGELACHKRFGEMTAVLAGDALLALAFEIMIGADSGKGGPAGKDKGIKEIADSAGPAGLVGGQWLDLTLSSEQMSEDQYLETAGKKTAALIKASVMAGALVAGAPTGRLEVLAGFGYSVGLAFQLRDDIIDSAGSASARGAGAVIVLGAEKAAARLTSEIERAVQLLQPAGIDSEELEYLARSLIN